MVTLEDPPGPDGLEDDNVTVSVVPGDALVRDVPTTHDVPPSTGHDDGSGVAAEDVAESDAGDGVETTEGETEGLVDG